MPNFAIVIPAATLGAGVTIPNALAGSPFEFVPRDSKVAIAAAVQPIQGTPGTPPNTNAGEVTANVTFGSELQLQNGAVPLGEGVSGSTAKIPDNVIVDDVAAAGDRLVVELNNAGAAGNLVSILVRILPI